LFLLPYLSDFAAAADTMVDRDLKKKMSPTNSLLLLFLLLTS
jgi:hypothetical protein